MKKIFTTLTFCMLFQASYALPLGNPSEASLFYYNSNYDCNCFCNDAISLGFGFYGDYVFERNMKTNTGHKVDHTSLYTNALYLVANYLELCDVFATVGATYFSFNTSLGPFNPPGVINPSPRFDFDSSSSFSWSVGARATLWECGCTSLGIEGQYFSSNTRIHRLAIRDNLTAYFDGPHADYSEWQIGLGLSRRVNIFVPYVGVKYSRAFWDFDDQRLVIIGPSVILHNQHSDKHWGYVAGVTLAPFDNQQIAFTAEGRFGDEKALYVNLSMKVGALSLLFN